MKTIKYSVKGRNRKIRLFENGYALRVSEENREKSSSISKNVGNNLFSSRGSNIKQIKKKELDPFVKAGWIFIEPKNSVRESLDHGELPEGTDICGRVYLDKNNNLKICTNKITIQFSEKLSKDESLEELSKYGLDFEMELKFGKNLFLTNVVDGTDTMEKVLALQKKENVLSAEPDFIQHIPLRFTPTDPQFGSQWQWANDGTGSATSGADISAEEAWDFTRGNGITVAVIDNGFDVTHTDLSPALTGQSGFFTAGGGGVANFAQGTGAAFPDSDHGTFCAGMSIARANNGLDGCGAANQSNFTAISCLADQVGTQATLGRAIAYAADPTQEVPGDNANNGADIISCSLGPNGADWEMENVLQNAIDFAVANGRGGLGTPIFWAVTNGNFTIDGADGTDEVVSYGNVIAVGRSTNTDTHDSSGFGPDLEFIAPGVNVVSTASGGGTRTSTGTSFAAPCAAGVGALVLAMNGNLTWQQLRQALRDTCDKVGGVTYDAAGRHNRYGFGRINAANAVCESGIVIDLATPSISFNDIPELESTVRAAVFNVRSCQSVTLQIINGPNTNAGPAGSFSAPVGTSTVLGTSSSFDLRQANIWIGYTGTNDGDVASGDVTIRCVETGDEWIININANTVARPTVAVSLVLDKSGSMNSSSGITFPGLDTRIEVLRYSALPLIDLIQEGNAISICAFDQDPHSEMNMTPVGSPAFGAGRTTARNVVTNHTPNPSGMTAIGDGVECGLGHLNSPAASGYDVKAMIILTDGHETASKYISDVSAQLNNEYVFSIGLGTADAIQPSALDALSNNTGGYLLMTGNLGNDDMFRLSKYYLQILAGVTNVDIVLDPEGTLFPGQKHTIPFYLNETDISSDIILLCPASQYLNFYIETPNGDIIDPGLAGTIPGVNFVQGANNSFYRINLPVPIGASGARSGKWKAILSLNKKGESLFDYNNDNVTHVNANTGSSYIQTKGIPYSLNVHAYSNLRMKSNLYQDSNEPGAKFTIRATFTEYGMPMIGVQQVKAKVEKPDGTKSEVILNKIGNGEFEIQNTANIPGVYKYLILANGVTLRGRPFTREQIVTGSVWKGGDNPFPGSDNNGGSGGNDHEYWCKVLNCFFNNKTMSPKFLKKMKSLGLNFSNINV